MTCTSFQGCPWRSNEHTGTEEWGKALNSWQGAAVVPAKGDCAFGVRSYRPRPASAWSSDTNAAAEVQHNAQAYLPKASRGVGQRILPSSQAAQLWNQCRPLMFL